MAATNGAVGANDKLEVFPAADGHYWRRVFRNRILSGGYEGFATRASAKRAALRANPDRTEDDVVLLTQDEEDQLQLDGKRD